MRLSSVLVGLALVTVQTPADAADEWTDAFHIASIYSYGDGLRVEGVPTNTNPKPCTNNTTYPLSTQVLPLASLSATAKEEMGKLVLSAHLAGKKIRLRISDAVCFNNGNNTRAYIAVKIE